jgi:catechol 2,3-dioxygenase-like lactoylglutathione lyase family enzyme
MRLSEGKVVPAIAVSEMGAARKFYEGKLGLANGEDKPDGGVRYPCAGGTELHVYPSPGNAGKSPATLVGFDVDDLGSAADELIANGVVFEHYDTDAFKTDERGIAQLGDVKTAWFKDPDGNILSLLEE